MKKTMAAPNQSSTPVEREIKRLLDAAGQDGKADSYRGKRHTERVADALPLEVTTDPGNPSAVWPATMQDISDGGLAFWSKRNIPPRTVIYIRHFSGDHERIWIPTFVTHCTVGIRGFLIGASFDIAADPPAGAPRTDGSPGAAHLPNGLSTHSGRPRR
jgi:hypothetical protein